MGFVVFMLFLVAVIAMFAHGKEYVGNVLFAVQVFAILFMQFVVPIIIVVAAFKVVFG